jgi:replicative DNA helicase
MNHTNTTYPIHELTDLELENIIIGSILIDTNVIDLVISNLRPADFYSTNNSEIYEAILELNKSGIGVDLETVFQELKRNNKHHDKNLFTYTDRIATTHHIEYHIALLKDISIKRHSTEFALNFAKKAFSNENTGKELLAELLTNAEELQNRLNLTKPMNFKDKFLETIKNIENGQSEALGYKTGFKSID